MSSPIKSLVTKLAKLLPIRLYSFIFTAYICPIKKALLFFGKLVKTAPFAVVGTSVITANPLVNIVVTFSTHFPVVWRAFPKIVSFIADRKIETDLRTEDSVSRWVSNKRLSTSLAIRCNLSMSSFEATLLRTVSFTTSFSHVLLSFKNLFADSARKNHSLSSKKAFASVRTNALGTLFWLKRFSTNLTGNIGHISQYTINGQISKYILV